MSDILAKINAHKHAEIEKAMARRPLAEVEKAAREALPPRGFAQKIARTIKNGHFALIAEIKKASPSKGLIREDFNPADIARAYEHGGATCLSVLTDEKYFQGHADYLKEARDACALPVLRKDFMLDPYQLFEARAMNADCILLIMASLDDDQARDLSELAHELGMDVLVEVHDEPEMERALQLDTKLIGINNRNLKTMDISLAVTEQLAPLVPDDRIIVGESGLTTHADLQRLAAGGVNCFLVGSSLMGQGDVSAATLNLLGDKNPMLNRVASPQDA